MAKKPAAKKTSVAKQTAANKSSDFAGFSPGLLHFYAELSLNNDRAWFEANKARYERDVREPARAFIRAMAPKLSKISKFFVADDAKVGGSLMRIHRDVRFAKDKAPYKTNLGIQFRHAAGKDVHAPGFYVHVDNDGVFIGAGLWHPEADALAAIRKAIVDKPTAWKKARDDAKFTKHWQPEGDSLARPPRGFDKDHPFIDDLRRKDHIAVCRLKTDQILGPKAVDLIATRLAETKPYVGFLCKALGEGF